MTYMKWFGAAIAGAVALGGVSVKAAELKEINFVEAVHNLGYTLTH